MSDKERLASSLRDEVSRQRSELVCFASPRIWFNPLPQEGLRNALATSENKISVDAEQMTSLQQELSQRRQEVDSLKIQLKSFQTSLDQKDQLRTRLESEKVSWIHLLGLNSELSFAEEMGRQLQEIRGAKQLPSPAVESVEKATWG
jgi:septal ring factor EnvC (AmiA/AmiB activator)